MNKAILLAILALAATVACMHRKSVAELEFERALGHTSLTVYPTAVRMGRTTQSDLDSAKSLAAEFERRKLGTAAVRDEPVVFERKGSFNQAKMYQQSKAAFAAYIRAHPPGSDYAVMAEYLLSTSGQVGGIHLYLVRGDGEPVGGVLLNSHWKEFKAVNPRSVQDATRALLLRLDTQWKPATS